jgi:hypothetical protein
MTSIVNVMLSLVHLNSVKHVVLYLHCVIGYVEMLMLGIQVYKLTVGTVPIKFFRDSILNIVNYHGLTEKKTYPCSDFIVVSSEMTESPYVMK